MGKWFDKNPSGKRNFRPSIHCDRQIKYLQDSLGHFRAFLKVPTQAVKPSSSYNPSKLYIFRVLRKVPEKRLLPHFS